MSSCSICNKNFKSNSGLKRHQTQHPNGSCVFECSNCFHVFTKKQNLDNHIQHIKCNKKFKCYECSMVFSRSFNLNRHIKTQHENTIIDINDIDQNNINQIKELAEKVPGLNITINHNHNHFNIDNIDNSKKQINNGIINNNNQKVVNKISFFETKPRLFRLDYVGSEELKQLAEHDEDIDEELLQDYLGNKNFAEVRTKEERKQMEKQKLQLEGLKMIFSELQKDPRNRTARIKKSKSGKCYIYTEKGWEEEKLQKVITKITFKLCNFVYDPYTNKNQYICMISKGQPKRMSNLRKFIEAHIIELNKESLDQEILQLPGEKIKQIEEI